VFDANVEAAGEFQPGDPIELPLADGRRMGGVLKAITDQYGFLNHVLTHLNVAEFRVADVPMTAVYGEEESSIGYPSFVRYDAAAQLADCRLVKVPLDGDLVHDLSAMARALTPRTKMVFVANPNNPTGTIVRKSEVDAFLRDLPDGVLLVLDEAYYEFAADVPDFPNSLDYVREGRPVVGLRTFSKAYGLAGIRIGYGFAPEEVVDAVDRAREPFDVNSLAQAAAVAALEDGQHVARTVANNRAGAERIAKALREAGARVYPTFANFVYADLGRPAQPVFEALLRQGVIVRTATTMGSPTGLRVSVGTPEEVDRFLEAFAKVVSSW
ncbi:MAG: aminotransferase class I/II-fold pyridoxal phosphate-dependent enzyme, partial [Fimbriimonadales bacterium]